MLALGHVWTLPNSLLGLLAGLMAVPFGARAYRCGCALAFRQMPRFVGALTLGGVILHVGDTLDVVVPTYSTRHVSRAAAECVSLAAHERAHVYQYLALGSLFLPTYFVCGGVTVRNRFERAADRYAATGVGWWPWSRRSRRYH